MKTVFNINKFLVIATTILYLTLYLGLYAQILLGAVQLISALGILFLWKQYNNKQQKHIILYWILTLCYGLGWLIVKDLNGLFLFILLIIIMPMSLAYYFTWILNNLKKTEL
ncbi:hypothetical protein [Olleya sp. UBA1516]|uniref:hypothetical protein n=1 Tax=Olleya sp. UBA1516 TaxID=1947013 RepID=UPI0025E921A4|nr:hypothetical protein [Olleya sp. UBA1516]|tara:strand:- start:959 stop:1294 length:336 start_codon:yes stop_codon:yes gene_type:complete